MWRCCFASDAADDAVPAPSAVDAAAAEERRRRAAGHLAASPLHPPPYSHARATVAPSAQPGGLRASLLHKNWAAGQQQQQQGASAAAAAASAASAFLPRPGEPRDGYDPLSDSSSSAVKVAVVVRPLLSGERRAGQAESVTVRHPSSVVLLPPAPAPSAAAAASNEQQQQHQPQTEELFSFDRVYRGELGSAAALKALHEECARPVIDRFCRGFNGTIMAYGQTGGGKTFSMGTMGGGGGAAAAAAAAGAAAAAAAAAAGAAGAGGGAGGGGSGGTPSGPSARRRRAGPPEPPHAATATAPPTASEAAALAAAAAEDAALAAAASAAHGLIPRALHRVFDYAARAAEEGTYDVHVTVSYVQVLNDSVHCLLGEPSQMQTQHQQQHQQQQRQQGGAPASSAAAAAFADAPPSPSLAAGALSSQFLNLPTVTLREAQPQPQQQQQQQQGGRTGGNGGGGGERGGGGGERGGGGGEVILEGAAEVPAASRGEVLALLALGNGRRATAPHLLNAESSRSHAVLTLSMTQSARLGAASGRGVPRELRALRSKLRLVDLAGSERHKETGSTGLRFAEGVAINRGLLALGNVINALAAAEQRAAGGGGGGGGDGKRAAGPLAAAQGQGASSSSSAAGPAPPSSSAPPAPTHIPYRDSKLTRLLQDSLGGNSETLLVACVSPSAACLDQTRGTLRYASRARRIRNRLTLNVAAAGPGGSMSAAEEGALRAEMRRLGEENARLRGALCAAGLWFEAAGGA